MSWLSEALDRGVTIRKAIRFDKKNPYKFDPAFGGLEVIHDKSNPGHYFDMHGREVGTEVAKLAGFDTNRLAKMRLKREKLAEFSKEVERQLALVEDTDEPVILAEAGDYKVVSLPAGRAKVVDLEFNDITPLAITEEEAMTLFVSLTRGVEEGKVDEVSTKKKEQ